MKQIRCFSLFLAVLLICGLYAPSTYAADSGPVLDSGIASQTYDSGAVILTRFDEPDRADAVAFALGTTREELSDGFSYQIYGFTGYDAEGNSYGLMSGTWSLKDVDTGTPGVYYAYTTPDLTGYVLGKGVALPKQLCAVSIQTPGKPDINCCVSGRGFLHFPWVLSQEQQNQLEQFTVRMRKDGGAWTQLSTGFCITSGDLQLPQRIFEYGSTYDLQVSYPGGQTGILTLLYNDELSVLDYSGGDRDGGDVNGGGASTGAQSAPTSSSASSTPNPESKPATVPTPGGKLGSSKPAVQNQGTSQGQSSSEAAKRPQEDNESTGETASSETPPIPATPADLPEPDPAREQTVVSVPETKPVTKNQQMPQGPDSSNAGTLTETGSIPQNTAPAVQESYSPTQTVISGLRLHDLCADEKSVVFGSGNLTVSIPSELLLTLNLRDTDTLSVKLMQTGKNQVKLAVDASGKAVTELPGTVLRLRYTPKSKNSKISVWNDAEKKAADAEFDGEFLRFSANASGIYAILETVSVPKTSRAARSGSLPLLPLMGGGMILAAGEIAFVRRKRNG